MPDIFVPCETCFDNISARTGRVGLRVCLKTNELVEPGTCVRCQESRPDLQIKVPDGGPTILNDGTIVYKKTGWEPPLNIDGYGRDKENRWVFHPLWPECDTREAEVVLAEECKCLHVKMFCDGQPVSLERCQECRATKA